MRAALPILLLCACPGPDDEKASEYFALAEGLPGALLSVNGTSATDVWVVGADGGDGPALLHRDASGWNEVTSDTPGDLWWVFPPAEGEAWVVGAGGRVVHVVDGAATTEVVDEDVTLFGIWGAEGQLWTVGADLSVGPGGGRLFHHDGAAWSSVALPETAATAAQLYKVWGRSASDVWVVGAAGLTLHWDGAAWTHVSSPSTRPLFTVNGTDAEVYAVGGMNGGTVLRYDGSAWTDESPEFAPQINGVWASGGAPFACGQQTSTFTRTDGAWVEDDREPLSPLLDYHACWRDPDGGQWYVGGNVSSFPLSQGIIGFFGNPDTPTLD